MELNRGDIYLVNFNPAKGGEMGKFRPAVVMSEELDNENELSLIQSCLCEIVK